MTNDNKHTPAPWIIDIDKSKGNWSYFIRAENRIQIAELNPHINPFTHGYGVMDNARLIAAAPELLEALMDCILEVETHARGCLVTLRKARAAIAKAKGE